MHIGSSRASVEGSEPLCRPACFLTVKPIDFDYASATAPAAWRYSPRSAVPLLFNLTTFFFEPKWRRVLIGPLSKSFILSDNPEHNCLRFGFFHFIGERKGFRGAHSPIASSKVVRCIIRHARPSQVTEDKANLVGEL